MHLVFVHGWGFTPEIWSPVLSRLDYSIRTTCVDLGFFKQSSAATELPDNAIFIGHSLGVMWAIKNMPQKIKGLVSICGFYRFTPFIEERTLRVMKQRVQRNCERQLADFQAQCNAVNFSTRSMPVSEKLYEGLEWLEEWNLEPEYLDLACPKLILAAKDDLIVPEKMTEQLWANEIINWTDTGGHALPHTKPDWIVEKLNEYLHDTR